VRGMTANKLAAADGQKARTFPAAWIVLAAMAPLSACLGVTAAGRAGVRMMIHDTSAAGYVVEAAFAVVVLAALLIEGGALLIGARTLWTSPQARTAGNIAAFLFGIMVTAGLIGAAVIPTAK
jgi:hypothetical protein